MPVALIVYAGDPGVSTWRARKLAFSERTVASNPDRVLAAVHTTVTRPQEISVKVEHEEAKTSNGCLGTDRQWWFNLKQEFLL